MREALLERAAGCSAPLGTDGLVVLIVPPIREVMLGLILLLVLAVDLLIVAVLELLLLGGVIVLRKELLGLIELPIRDVMLELILPFELLRLLELLRVFALLRLDWLDVGELGRIVICRPSVLEFGAVDRELIDLLDVLLLGDRLVMLLLELLVLGVRLVMALLELLLLGVRLVIALLELRLDETLLERLDDDDLDEDLGAGAGLETCRVC